MTHRIGINAKTAPSSVAFKARTASIRQNKIAIAKLRKTPTGQALWAGIFKMPKLTNSQIMGANGKPIRNMILNQE